MQQVAIFIITLALLFSVAAFGWFYIRFEWLPIRVKARAIGNSARILRAGKDEHEKKRHAITRDFDARIEAVRDNALQAIFQAIPLSKLDEYPGIGPATVDKLQRAGYQDLPSLTQARIESISGFGQKRAADVRGALRALHKDAASRLDSGACPESRQIEPKKAALRKEKELRLAECDFWNQWRIDKLNAMKATIDLAEQVSFIPWLFGHPLPDDLPDPPDLTPPAYVAPVSEVPRPKSVQAPSPQPPAPTPVGAVEPPRRSVALPEPTRPKSEVAYRTGADPSAKRSEPSTPSNEGQSWVPRDEMEIVARIGMAVGMADGKFSEKEQLALRRFLNEIFGGDPQKKNRIGSILAECLLQKVELEKVLEAASARLSPALWPVVVSMTGQIADTGGKRGAQEAATIERIRARLTVAPIDQAAGGNRTELPSREKIEPSPTGPSTSQPPLNARKSLEILESAPLNARLIRSQWKAIREKFDPAKFMGHGEEFSAMAEAKRQAADEAAKTLLKELGETPTLDEPVKDLRANPDLDAAFGL